MSYGRYYEEFAVGQAFTHWPGRTITEADCTWFALLTMNQHPLHSDAHYAQTYTQHKQRVVMGPLVYSQFIQQNNWPFGGAIAFILMTATLILTLAANLLVQQRYRSAS